MASTPVGYNPTGESRPDVLSITYEIGQLLSLLDMVD